MDKEGSFPKGYVVAEQALKEKADVAICDTSGRLHTNWKLMEELEKCHRAIQKKVRNAPNEVLLVLDGTTGETWGHSQ